MISQETVNKVFDTVDIVEVISDYVSLKKSGTNYKGLSPFSNEKTASFMVSPSKGIFKDFSSGKGGNAVGFLMEHEKLSYPEALQYLARKYNIEFEETEITPEEIKQRNERESLLAVTQYAQKYFTDQLHTAEGKAIGLSYLRQRGFRDDIIEKFQLGYSPEDRKGLTIEAQKNGYKKEYLVKTGLTIEKEDYVFDRFAGRIIFPIHGISGNVVGFGGRTLKTDKNTAKYLNSPESDIYHKSRLLYGLFQAKKNIVNANRCFLVEGYTDVIALHQAGVQNVVSSSGTALTTEQIRLIKRFTENITVLYDGDAAGLKASFRGIDMILEEGLNVKVLLLPDGEDPDSFAQSRSSSEFIEFIDTHEQDFITFKTEVLIEDTQNDPIKRANMITDIVKSVAVIPDGIKRSVFLKECSGILSVDESVLYNEVNKIRGALREQSWKRERSRPDQLVVPQQPTVPAFVKGVFSQIEEREIIYFLLKFGNQSLKLAGEENAAITVSQYIIREIQNDELEFTNLVYKQVFEDVKGMIDSEKNISERVFTFHDNKEIQDLAVDIVTSKYELSKVWKRKDSYIELPGENLGVEVPKALLLYKLKVVDVALEELRKQVEEEEKKKNTDRVMELMAHLRDLELAKNEISKVIGERIILR
ncbi:MAG: DNA primase [Bacteroidales bacterium]|jgi:DNA primase|nr:DNA primase [Bacteroidales bacterium]